MYLWREPVLQMQLAAIGALLLDIPFPLQSLQEVIVGIVQRDIYFSIMRNASDTMHQQEVSIRSQSGILLRRGTEIPLERIASTVEEHPFYLRPLRAACLQISTAAGAVPEADMHLTLYLRDLHRLRQMSRSDPGDAGGDGKAGTSSVNITKSGR